MAASELHRAAIPRVVVVGAGFGGLNAARALRDAPVEIALVDRHNYHTFQPLLYQVATAGLEPEEIAHSARAIFHRQRNLRFHLGAATGVDWGAKRLRLASGEELAFDWLVLAAGASTNDFGVPGVREHAFPLKSLPEAIALRGHVIRQFELADRDRAWIEKGALTFVVVGGGPTGVEMCGALVELFDKVLSKDFPALEMAHVRVILVERTDSVLGTFHESLRAYARATLERRGVDVRLGVSVTRASEGEVELSTGETIRTRTLIWAAGVRANLLADALGLEQIQGKRIAVSPDLSIPSHPEAFVVGDMAGSRDAAGKLHPQLAPVAIQGGRHVAAQILNRIAGRPAEPFVYRDPGTMATIGRNAGVCELASGFKARGFVAWLMWLGLHLVQLIGFRNRLNVLVNWAWNYVTYDRSARLIVELPRDEAQEEET